MADDDTGSEGESSMGDEAKPTVSCTDTVVDARQWSFMEGMKSVCSV